MKIAILSDIHGNLEALNAVVKDLKSKNGIDLIVCLGDIVGYYPHPNECINIIREMCDHVIQGNQDATAVSPNFDVEVTRCNDVAASSLIYTRNLLLKSGNSDNYNFLKELPDKKELTISKKKILFVHGTPNDKWEYFLYPYWLNAPLDEQKIILNEWFKQWDVIAMGHSHWAFQYESWGRMIINPGSVGQPRDDNPKSSYAIVEVTKTRLKAQNFRINYDIEKTCEAVLLAKLDKSLCDRIVQGH
ncbi:MAG: metallophosphoesterase family protein [Candidatus Heimdallarchaeota archaeon]|nr:metallophosphoesterase family protein [Candidatus Heimdallarchaeota archaeon]